MVNNDDYLPSYMDDHLSNAPVKSNSTKNDGMCSTTVTCNRLKSLKYSMLIGQNQFLPKNVTSSVDYSPENSNH